MYVRVRLTWREENKRNPELTLILISALIVKSTCVIKRKNIEDIIIRKCNNQY